MRLASIDIGTNTLLLLVADIDKNGNLQPIAFEQRLPRLGKDVDQLKSINHSAFERISAIILEYKAIAARLQASNIIACGTSAIREAANRSEFISYIETKTGIAVEVLSGDDEALWTYRGAVSDVQGIPFQTLVLDIGGGSTEISFPNPNQQNGNLKLNRYSLQLGSVRLTERYFKHNPPLQTEVENATQFILEELSQVHNPGFHKYQLIGVAGTATTLACLDQQLMEFDIDKVTGYRMDQQTVLQWSMKLQSMTIEQIRSLSNTTEGRADILTAGVLILSETMKLFGLPSLEISERGLRYGLILREWERNVRL